MKLPSFYRRSGCDYLYPSFASHLIGYLGIISEQ